MNKLIAKTLIASGVALSALSSVHATEQNKESTNRESINNDSSKSVGQYVDDTAITAKVKAKHAEDKLVSAMGVSVETKHGVVILSGEAKTRAEIQRAELLAKQVEGVKSVSNMIELKPKS